MKEKNLNIRYKCKGEIFKDNVNFGYCGDIKSLKKWIDVLYPMKKREEMYNYCNDYIIKSIYFAFGKRLEKEQ